MLSAAAAANSRPGSSQPRLTASPRRPKLLPHEPTLNTHPYASNHRGPSTSKTPHGLHTTARRASAITRCTAQLCRHTADLVGRPMSHTNPLTPRQSLRHRVRRRSNNSPDSQTGPLNPHPHNIPRTASGLPFSEPIRGHNRVRHKPNGHLGSQTLAQHPTYSRTDLNPLTRLQHIH